MENLNYETIVRKLITRHNPKQDKCKKCGKMEPILLSTNCSNCGKEFSLDYEKLKFAVDLLKGFIYKYSNTNNDPALDSEMQSHLSNIIWSTDKNYLGNIAFETDKNIMHFLTIFFDFVLENKIVLGNPIYKICILPDFKTIYLNPIEDPNFQNHFGNVEFGLPYFYGTFAYIKEFYENLKPSLWKKIKKIF